MAQIFLSYDRGDGAIARLIAQALEKAGHDVWWDRHIAGGAQYSKEIEAALDRADAVVVLWSEKSVESGWVRDEAAAGRDTGRLVPVRLDHTDPPLGFRQYQSIDLPGGRLGRAARTALLNGIAQTAGARPLAAAAEPSLRRLPWRAWLVSGLAIAVLAAAIWWWRPWSGQRGEVVLSVAAADDESASRALARDLVIRLAGLHTASSGAIRLVDAADAGQTPDLTFEASASAPAHASLVLKAAKDGSLLWSKDFEQPQGQRADLLQQLAYTAARVTDCAVESLEARAQLKAAALKTYLNACAQLTDLAVADPKQPAMMLREVIDSSPRFKPAWSKLLMAEAVMAAPQFTGSETDPASIAQLRRHIGQARKLEPAMAEATIAEAMLLPPRDIAGRVRRIEDAAAKIPDNPEIVSQLADAMSRTGRMRKAVEAAARAAELDPLSPSIHSGYIALLAYAGSMDAARRELSKAEKLWPGTASLRDAQFRFHLRYGDPRIALTLFEEQSGAGGNGPRLFLEARQNPTPANVERFLDYVRDRLRNMENPSAGIGFATLAYGHFAKHEEVFATLLAWPKPDDVAIISDVLFRPEFHQIRRDPRFLRIAQRAGLLNYWRKSGKWPDFCFERAMPYDCKQEARKYR